MLNNINLKGIKSHIEVKETKMSKLEIIKFI